MDHKKQIKNFIDYICEWVNDRYKNYNEDGFSYTISGDDKLSYIIRDKAIDKRIDKTLKNKYNINAEVIYEINTFSVYEYSGGEIRIRIK